MATALLTLALAGPAGAAREGGAAPCGIATRAEAIGGGTIVYNVAGAGPNVLLVHGLFADKEQWNPLVCRLADAGYTAIAVDLPGYGKSSGFPVRDYALDYQVGLLHLLTVRLGIVRMDIAGNSMGGAIASLYAGRFPQQVRTLAFLGSPLGVIRWSDGLREAMYAGFNPFIPVDVPQLDLELKLLFVTPPPLPEVTKQSIVADYASRNLHYVQVWNIVGLYDDVLQQREVAAKPALIVWGIDDRVFSVSGADRLRRRFPGSVVHAMPHAGHLLHVENASEVAPIYLEFLRSRR